MNASASLQIALIATLRSAPAVTAHLGQRIWDNAPRDAHYPYLTLGTSQELDDSADCIEGAECFQQIDIWTQEDGAQMQAKEICGAVKQALSGFDLDLAPHVLTLLEVTALRIIGDPDERITHGIVTVRALVEAG